MNVSIIVALLIAATVTILIIWAILDNRKIKDINVICDKCPIVWMPIECKWSRLESGENVYVCPRCGRERYFIRVGHDGYIEKRTQV